MSKKAYEATLDELDFLDKREALAYTHTSEPIFDKRIRPFVNLYGIGEKKDLYDKAELKLFIKRKCIKIRRK